jgi:dipeptidase
MLDPLSCDTSVALGAATVDGSTIFAKNSDRSANEAQPLIHVPRASHAPGETLACQYIEIPQVETTWEVIGSRPCWLWGFEMGVNEWGVAIGNEAVLTREPYEERALIGMDLVRLGLERGRTAGEAKRVICALIERYGQGGSCEESFFRTYHNSFIIADPESAWIVEAAGHHWAARRARDRAAIGNLLTIGTDFDDVSGKLIGHAHEAGFATAPFDFAAAYRDPEADLSTRVCRLDRARAILGGHAGKITVPDMMALLSDHNGGDLPERAEPLPTLCMHGCPERPGETAASMVAHLKPGHPRELTATVWTAFGSPCLSVYRPVYPFAVGLPAHLNDGASTCSSSSPWWTFERLQRLVAANPSLAARVRPSLQALQAAFFNEAAETEASAAALIAAGAVDEARARLRRLVDNTTERALSLAEELTHALLADAPLDGNPVMAAFWAEMNEKAGLEFAAAAATLR